MWENRSKMANYKRYSKFNGTQMFCDIKRKCLYINNFDSEFSLYHQHNFELKGTTFNSVYQALLHEKSIIARDWEAAKIIRKTTQQEAFSNQSDLQTFECIQGRIEMPFGGKVWKWLLFAQQTYGYQGMVFELQGIEWYCFGHWNKLRHDKRNDGTVVWAKSARQLVVGSFEISYGARQEKESWNHGFSPTKRNKKELRSFLQAKYPSLVLSFFLKKLENLYVHTVAPHWSMILK